MKTIIKWALISCIALLSSISHAWEPSGPITVIVPGTAGSLHDSAFRSMIPYFEKNTNISFVFDYKPGGGGLVATKHFLNQSPNGHQILLASSIGHMMGPITNSSIATWDPLLDFEYTINTIASTLVIVNSKDNAVSNPGDLVTRMKDTTKPLLVGTTFPNQKALLIQLAQATNSPIDNIKFINYDSPGKVLTDIVNGNIELFIGGLPPTISFVQSGKLKYVASTSEARPEVLPNVPTINEQYPGIFQISYIGVLLPKGTPKEVINWYVKNLGVAVKSEEATSARKKLQVYLDERGLTPDTMKNMFITSRTHLEPIYKNTLNLAK